MKPPLNIVDYKLRGFLRGRCLDAGAGDGRHLVLMDNVVAFDKKIDGDLDEPLSFEDSSFDTVLCSHVLEHLRDPMFTLSEFHRILRVGGTLVVGVPNQRCFHTDFYGDDYPLHLSAWNHSRLRRALERSGFQVAHGHYTNYPLGGGLLFLLFNKTPLLNIMDDIWFVTRKVG